MNGSSSSLPVVPEATAIVELPDRPEMALDEVDQFALAVVVETFHKYRKQGGERLMQELADDTFGEGAPKTALGAKMRWQWLKLAWGKRKEIRRLIAAGVPEERADFDAIALGPEHPFCYLNTLRGDANHWWSRVQDCGVPMPRTAVVPLGEDLVFSNVLRAKRTEADVRRLEDFLRRCEAAATEVGYPIFVRTGSMSGKHAGPMMYRARNLEELAMCVQALVQATLSVDGVPFTSLMLRQWLDLEGGFHAFGPLGGDGHLIAREFRAFAGPGYETRVDAYWPINAMQFNGPEPDGWREILSKQNQLSPAEESHLKAQAEHIVSCLDGAWSIDFAQGRNGQWYFVDCAPAEMSHDHRSKEGITGRLNALTDKDMEPLRQLYRDEPLETLPMDLASKDANEPA
jgi:hypothetical protein